MSHTSNSPNSEKNMLQLEKQTFCCKDEIYRCIVFTADKKLTTYIVVLNPVPA